MDIRLPIETHDRVYEWKPVSTNRLTRGCACHELTLVSQQWQGIIWHHTLQIILPAQVKRNPALVLFLIMGSDKTETAVAPGARMADAIGSPVVIIHDIPNQPLFGGLREDDLIAHTFLRFLKTKDYTWPLLVPMVKGVVRGMDAAAEFLQDQLQLQTDGFVVSGASKRGWTAWLTAVADKRVRAIAPMAYNNLNLAKQMRHHRKTWGRFSEKISDYTHRRLPQRLLGSDQAVRELAPLVDPFSYLEKITVPKLIIIGTNDAYWPLDALDLYYDELVGEKYLLWVPNAGHAVGLDMDRVAQDMIAFFLNVDGRLRLPHLTGKSEEGNGAIDISLTSDIPPRDVKTWRSFSGSRDFRNAVWTPCETRQEGRTFQSTLPKPDIGHVAVFSEATFFEGGREFFLSTAVNIF